MNFRENQKNHKRCQHKIKALLEMYLVKFINAVEELDSEIEKLEAWYNE